MKQRNRPRNHQRKRTAARKTKFLRWAENQPEKFGREFSKLVESAATHIAVNLRSLTPDQALGSPTIAGIFNILDEMLHHESPSARRLARKALPQTASRIRRVLGPLRYWDTELNSKALHIAYFQSLLVDNPHDFEQAWNQQVNEWIHEAKSDARSLGGPLAFATCEKALQILTACRKAYIQARPNKTFKHLIDCTRQTLENECCRAVAAATGESLAHPQRDGNYYRLRTRAVHTARCCPRHTGRKKNQTNTTPARPDKPKEKGLRPTGKDQGVSSH